MSMHPGLRVWAVVAVATLLALTIVLLASTPAATSSTGACRVTNERSGIVTATLQAAVSAARSGDRLSLRGTCHGTVTIRMALHIRGVTSMTLGRPVLDGDEAGTVVRVLDGAQVTIADLVIRDGLGRRGGGIRNTADLILRDVVVRDCSARFGGGIHNAATATLRLTGSTTISRSEGSWKGGGIFNRGSVVLDDASAVRDDVADWGGGIFSVGGRIVVREHARVQDNESFLGGGFFLDGTLLTLAGESVVSGNGGGNVGGGIYGGRIVLRDSSSIRGNSAMEGGGIGVAGTITLRDSSSIHHNTANAGAGISMGGQVSLAGSSSIHHNVADEGGGGGVLMFAGRLELAGQSQIRENTAAEPGGGILHDDDVVLSGVVCAPDPDPNVFGNTPDDCTTVDVD